MAKKKKNKYETHVKPRLIEIKGWVRGGMIDKDVAKKLGVAYSTFRMYVDKYEELAKVLAESKEVADYEVENALYNSALGYEFEEVKEIKTPKLNSEGEIQTDEEGNPIFVVSERIVTKKRVAGNVTAQQFWLKNRVPDKYRDKIDMSVKDTEIKINFSIPRGEEDGNND